MTIIKKTILSFYLLIAIVFTLVGYILFSVVSQANFEFIVFDIGQGDAILIRTLNNNILIDGGPDNTLVYKLGQYLPFYDRRIDLMILTHPHSDHLAGFLEVLKRYKVKKIFFTGVNYQSAEYLTWLKLIEEQGIKVVIAGNQKEIIIDNNTKLEILFPLSSLIDQEIKNTNDTSIVAKLIYQDFSVMLTGDFEDEESLLNKNLDLAADILKVGHHGSDNANDPGFLKAVNPGLAVISVGQDNKFNHPHLSTVKNIETIGTEIFRTDFQGDFYFSLP